MGVVGNRIFQQSAVGLVLFGVEIVFILKRSNSSSSSSNNSNSSSNNNNGNSLHKKP